jgi:hypothetical protein
LSSSFRRSEDRSRFQISVAEYLVTSHEVGRSAECYEHRSSRPIGLPTPTSNLLFPTARWFSLDAVPRSLASPGSSSRELRLPFRVHPALSPVRPRCRNTSAEHLPGFPSHSRHEQSESTNSMSFPWLTFVSPSAFLTLSTIFSSDCRVGLFHPTATSGIRTSGVFPAAKPARLIGESSPHVVGGTLLPVSCPTGSRSFHSAFRALIRAAIRCA